jgi:KRAB domain-containing zinc finger protein
VHLQTIHENIRPFSCSTCGKGFKQRIHLLGHFISTHSNVKPFKCELCPARFSKKWNLFDHVRKHHSGTNADLDRLKFKYSKRRKSSEIDD